MGGVVALPEGGCDALQCKAGALLRVVTVQGVRTCAGVYRSARDPPSAGSPPATHRSGRLPQADTGGGSAHFGGEAVQQGRRCSQGHGAAPHPRTEGRAETARRRCASTSPDRAVHPGGAGGFGPGPRSLRRAALGGVGARGRLTHGARPRDLSARPGASLLAVAAASDNLALALALALPVPVPVPLPVPVPVPRTLPLPLPLPRTLPLPLPLTLTRWQQHRLVRRTVARVAAAALQVRRQLRGTALRRALAVLAARARYICIYATPTHHIYHPSYICARSHPSYI